MRSRLSEVEELGSQALEALQHRLETMGQETQELTHLFASEVQEHEEKIAQIQTQVDAQFEQAYQQMAKRTDELSNEL